MVHRVPTKTRLRLVHEASPSSQVLYMSDSMYPLYHQNSFALDYQSSLSVVGFGGEYMVVEDIRSAVGRVLLDRKLRNSW